ncbi:MAG TPA: chemotaxis protein CheB [Xanthobacteraceae bacterium]|nr:chemotaxis protein CheB [Xanthobacteraceae bacterium]
MTHRDILAIGTSAGGFEALRLLAQKLPADFPASILVVIHLSSEFHSALDTILSHAGPLTASFAEHGERLRYGHIFIAPPKSHLLLDGDHLTLGHGPRENNARPAIDPLFRSVAACCGPRAVGAVLTGTLGDGASGLQALQQCGGIAVVQDPADAAFAEMPLNALRALRPDHVAGLHDMPALLARLAREPAGAPVEVPPAIKLETDIARTGRSSMSTLDRIGRRSVLACPECHGVMWEIDEGDVVRYRCHIGHAYTADLMSLALDASLRQALGAATRALDERIALARKLHRQSEESGHRLVAASWARKLREAEEEARTLRDAMARADEIARRYAEDEADDEAAAADEVTAANDVATPPRKRAR